MEYLVPILTGYKYTKQPPAQFHHHSVVPILCTQSVFRRKSILFFFLSIIMYISERF